MYKSFQLCVIINTKIYCNNCFIYIMPRKKERLTYEDLVREHATLDQRIAVVENMCVNHIVAYKNVIYNKKKKDTIVITNELQGLFFLLDRLLKEQASTSTPSK